MARRKSVRIPVLKDWTDVDAALREIGEAELKKEEIEGDMTRKINEIKDKAAATSQPIDDRIEKLTRDIEDFVEAHRDDFDGKKTRVLNFGETGWRQSTSVIVPSKKDELDEVIRRLRSRQMEKCVVVKETVDKEILRTYGEDVVHAVGARWKQTDKFWCEANKEKLKDVK